MRLSFIPLLVSMVACGQEESFKVCEESMFEVESLPIYLKVNPTLMESTTSAVDFWNNQLQGQIFKIDNRHKGIQIFPVEMGPQGVLATTFVNIFGKKTDGHFLLNDENSYIEVYMENADVQTLAHELGHILGLDHVNEPTLMHPIISGSFEVTCTRP